MTAKYKRVDKGAKHARKWVIGACIMTLCWRQLKSQRRQICTVGNAMEGVKNIIEEALAEKADENIMGMEGLSLVDLTAVASEGSSAHKASGKKAKPKLVVNPL